MHFSWSPPRTTSTLTTRANPSARRPPPPPPPPPHQSHQSDIFGTVATHLSSFWNVVDLSVAGLSVTYFILKGIQMENSHMCWALGTAPRDTLSLNCILLSLRVLHTLVSGKRGPANQPTYPLFKPSIHSINHSTTQPPTRTLN